MDLCVIPLYDEDKDEDEKVENCLVKLSIEKNNKYDKRCKLGIVGMYTGIKRKVIVLGKKDYSMIRVNCGVMDSNFYLEEGGNLYFKSVDILNAVINAWNIREVNI